MNLQPGDILLWRVGPGASLIPRLIGWGERKLRQPGDYAHQYYHVGLVAANPDWFYESTWPRIAYSPVPLPLPPYIEAYRLKVPPTKAQLQKIYAHAESEVGKPYPWWAIATFGFVQFGDFPYCSEYVWRSFTAGGILLCPWDALESPDDIAAADTLEQVMP